MKQTFIFALEPLDARYTKQWYDEVPSQLDRYTGADRLLAPESITVIGKQRSKATSKGAFLDFADTNYWKSTQLAEFTDLMQRNLVPDDAVILFTDFWNPALIQVAYMRDLLGTNWSIHGIAHAGAYDPSDILGYKMKPNWPLNFERSLFYASDKTYFATEFHRTMFLNNLDIPLWAYDKAVVAGQPYMYLLERMSGYHDAPKQNRIMWPHRYNDDKQPEIAEDLSNDFSVFITQKHNLSKEAYYVRLAESKMVFSCSLHENLGMSMIEGTLVGALPIVPDRAAYSEIYLPQFLYPPQWTENFKAYQYYKKDLTAFISEHLENYDEYAKLLPEQVERIKKFIDPTIMFQHMMGEE